MAATPRLSLSFLAVGQAQKEFTVNENLQSLDTIVAGAIEEPPLAAPPVSPVLGACYIVATNATGDWFAKDHCLAAWTTGGWRFLPPVEGMCLLERASSTWAVYRSDAWEIGLSRAASLLINDQQVVGPRLAGIESPSGGTVIDAEGRAAIDAIVNALRGHGLIES